ncbi:MAG: hypothetical protein QXT28_07840 [Thermofilaceae archaeon]
MARRTVRPEEIRGSTCALISTREGGFYLVAKAAPIYGDPNTKGKVFALVVGPDGKPVKVASEGEARAMGCAVVKVPRRNVPKRKLGHRELERLGLYEFAKQAVQVKAPSTKVKKYRIGFLPARIIAKLVTAPTKMRKK